VVLVVRLRDLPDPPASAEGGTNRDGDDAPGTRRQAAANRPDEGPDSFPGPPPFIPLILLRSSSLTGEGTRRAGRFGAVFEEEQGGAGGPMARAVPRTFAKEAGPGARKAEARSRRPAKERVPPLRRSRAISMAPVSACPTLPRSTT